MEKLELKHLAPYLPYELKVSQPRHGKNEPYLLYGLKYSNYAKEWTAFIDDSRHGNYQNVYLKGVKTILRPLSDLTKEIEHNGEKFVPYDEIKKLYSNTPQFTDYKENWINFYGIMDSKCEYVCVQKLIEYHFDVFGLIDKGLAIDINTLNN